MIESFIQELSFVPLCLLLYYSFWGEIEGEVLFCKSATSKERKASYSITLLEFLAKLIIPTLSFVCLYRHTKHIGFVEEIKGEVLFCKSATSKERKASNSVTFTIYNRLNENSICAGTQPQGLKWTRRLNGGRFTAATTHCYQSYSMKLALPFSQRFLFIEK